MSTVSIGRFTRLVPALLLAFGCGVTSTPDRCLNVTCGANAQCSEGACSCKAGFSGDAAEGCSAEDTCFHMSCSGHGTCNAMSGVGVCTCATGYDGANCERCAEGYVAEGDACVVVVVDPCDARECGDNGSCEVNGTTAACACDAGYTGAACDICDDGYVDVSGACIVDPCVDDFACGDHGTCALDGASAVCACDVGYTGVTCESCDDGFVADDAGACVADPCANYDCGANGACVADGEAPSCSCTPGYAGDVCDLRTLAVVQRASSRPYTFASLQREDSAPLEGALAAVHGTLAGQPIDGVVEGGLLHVFLPKLVAGAYPLEIVLPGGLMATGILTLEDAPPIDVEATLAAIAARLHASFDAGEADVATLSDSESIAQLQSLNETLRTRVAEWEAFLQTATPEQREAAAYAFAANEAALAEARAAFDELRATLYSRAPVDIRQVKVAFLQFSSALGLVLEKTALGALVGAAIVGVGGTVVGALFGSLAGAGAGGAAGLKFGASVGALLAIMDVIDDVVTSWLALNRQSFVLVDMVVDELRADVEVLDERSKPFIIDGHFRRVQAADVASDIGWIGTVLRAIEVLRSAVNRVGYAANIVPFAPSIVEEGLPAFGEAVTVEVVGNPLVTATLGGTHDAPTLTFNSTDDEKQHAQFRVRYRREELDVASPLNNVLVLPKSEEGCTVTVDPLSGGVTEKVCKTPDTGEVVRVERCIGTTAVTRLEIHLLDEQRNRQHLAINWTGTEGWSKATYQYSNGEDVMQAGSSMYDGFLSTTHVSYSGLKNQDACTIEYAMDKSGSHYTERMYGVSRVNSNFPERWGLPGTIVRCRQTGNQQVEYLPYTPIGNAAWNLNALDLSSFTVPGMGVCGTDLSVIEAALSQR